MQTELLKTDPPQVLEASLSRAVALLKAGRLVAIPTETVYGLAADATNPAAIARIYETKGRPSHNPLIVHVGSLEQARQWAADWTPLAERLANHFWPGPLTLVVRVAPGLAPAVLAGGDTVGLRIPAHPTTGRLLAQCGIPLAAPSANRSNRLSPTSPQAVLDTLDGRIDAVLDGGSCTVGIESSVIDATGDVPKILRPGMLSAEILAEVCGCSPEAIERGHTPELDATESASPLRSPGNLSRHYAPAIPLELIDHYPDTLPEDCYLISCDSKANALASSRVSVMPTLAASYARMLYAALRKAESSGAERILLQTPPKDEAWEAIHDRLRRAANR